MQRYPNDRKLAEADNGWIEDCKCGQAKILYGANCKRPGISSVMEEWNGVDGTFDISVARECVQ